MLITEGVSLDNKIKTSKKIYIVNEKSLHAFL
jgi:hypothetical protein